MGLTSAVTRDATSLCNVFALGKLEFRDDTLVVVSNAAAAGLQHFFCFGSGRTDGFYHGGDGGVSGRGCSGHEGGGLYGSGRGHDGSGGVGIDGIPPLISVVVAVI